MKCTKKSECKNGFFHRMFDIEVWEMGIDGPLEFIGGRSCITPTRDCLDTTGGRANLKVNKQYSALILV